MGFETSSFRQRIMEAESAVVPSPAANRCVPHGMVFDSPGFRPLSKFKILPPELEESPLPCKQERFGSIPIGGSSPSIIALGCPRGSSKGRTGAFEAHDRGSIPRPLRNSSAGSIKAAARVGVAMRGR